MASKGTASPRSLYCAFSFELDICRLQDPMFAGVLRRFALEGLVIDHHA
jgi:hypothetical protein